MEREPAGAIARLMHEADRAVRTGELPQAARATAERYGMEAMAGKLAALRVPFHANPIVERLQRQMHVGGRLEFDHGEAAQRVARKQVDNASITRGECRRLTVYRLKSQVGIDEVQPRSDHRLEPCLRLISV